MARPDVMDKLLRRTRQVPVKNGRTHFHRGRHAKHSSLIGDLTSDDASEGERPAEDEFAESYDEMSVEDVYNGEVGDVSRHIDTRFLAPIQDRFCHCTGRDADDVLPLPVYFDLLAPNDHGKGKPWGTVAAKSRTPNVVNMQVLPTEQTSHLLVPRPCGPRLPPDEAQRVVQEVLTEIGREGTAVRRPSNDPDRRPGFPFWAWRGLKTSTLALFFTREKRDGHGNRGFSTKTDRARIIKCIEAHASYTRLPDTLQRAVDDTPRALLDANPGASAVLRSSPFDDWYRLHIPEATIDVLALYTRSALEETGCRVHFVDAWFYHTLSGGAHCATDVLRKPPTAASPQRAERPPWWEVYPKLAAADTTYRPARHSLRPERPVPRYRSVPLRSRRPCSPRETTRSADAPGSGAGRRQPC